MAAWQAMSPFKRLAIIVGGPAVVAGLGYLGWQMGQPAAVPVSDQKDPVEVAAEPAPSTAAATPEAAAPVPLPTETASAAPEPAAPEAPRFDSWRVAADGSAVVSGRAGPDAQISVLVDGAVVAESKATGSGEFAILFTLPPNDKPSLMTLTMALPDGTKVASDQTIALEAIKGPEPVADAAVPEEELAAKPETPAEAETAPAAILLTDEGASVLQKPEETDPEQQTTVSIETISYTPQGDVQLGGRGQAGAFIRIYLNNDALQTALVPESGQWLTTLNDTPPGVYTLRVDQLDDAGKVTSRFETPFKRETLEALAAVASAGAPDQPALPEDPAAEPAPAPQPEAPPVATGAEATTVSQPPVLAEPTPAVAEPAIPEPVTITVQPGFTLWGIAQEKFGDGVFYVQVFEANRDKIKNPDLIYPGQVFAMPASN
jgi:LysM repeat protein